MGHWLTVGIADLALLTTLLAIRQKFLKPSFWEVMNAFVLVAYANLAASRFLLQLLLACLNFALDLEDLFGWHKQKNWFLWTMGAAQACENDGDERGLTWYLRWGIYTSFLTWTHSQNSLAAAESLSLKISFHGTSLKWSRRPWPSANSHKLCDEMGHPVLSLLESQWKLKQQHDQNFPMEGKPL